MAVKSGAFRGSAPIFAALGDGTRLRLVARLCAGGPQSIARLTAGSEITRQAVTKHLLVLADAGLVRGVRAAPRIHARDQGAGRQAKEESSMRCAPNSRSGLNTSGQGRTDPAPRIYLGGTGGWAWASQPHPF